MIGLYTLDLTRNAVNYFSWTELARSLGIMILTSDDFIGTTVFANHDYALGVL